MHEDDSFKVWADKWLSNKSATVSAKDYQTYSGYRNRFAALDDIQLNKIKQQDIQDIINKYAKYNEHTKKPTAKRTLKGYIIAIQQIFDLAIKNRVLQFNPALDIVVPISAPTASRRALTKEEQQWILDTPHEMQRAAIIMMLSGLRRGELIPLTWQDIDFNEGTISVNKSVRLLGSNIEVKQGGKTKTSTRIVNIPSKLLYYLKSELNNDRANGKLNLLVCPDTKTNGMINGERWRNLWDSYLMTLNNKYGIRKSTKVRYNKEAVLTIPNITAHWLRHTFCTMLYLAGIDVLTAKEQMGHSSVDTTLRIYTHLDQQYKKKSVSKLDEYLNNNAI